MAQLAGSSAIYSDPKFAMLGDLVNARAKLRFAALAHIITARILDIHPSCEELEKLLEDPQNLDNLFCHIALEVAPGVTAASPDNVVPLGGHAGIAGQSIRIEMPKSSSFEKLPRSNSWSDLLQFDRA
jgi:hypothetical protein